MNHVVIPNTSEEKHLSHAYNKYHFPGPLVVVLSHFILERNPFLQPKSATKRKGEAKSRKKTI
jgi:hypothetical protein